MQMRAGKLDVEVSLPSQETKKPSPSYQVPQDFSAIRHLLASKGVEIIDQNRRIISDQALFAPKLNQAHFDGGAKLEFPGIQLSGDRMQTRTGAIQIYGGTDTSPAKMQLQQNETSTEHTTQQNKTSLVQVLAQQIAIEELATQIRLHFKDRVTAHSEDLKLNSNELICHVNQTHEVPSKLQNQDLSVQFADLERMYARGAVEAYLHAHHARADAMEYDPLTATAYLSGNPQLKQGLYRVSGYTMKLNKAASLVEGTSDQRVHAILPPLQVIAQSQKAATASEATEDLSLEALPTEITSLNLKHSQDAEQTTFEFTGQVQIEGTNLVAQCGHLIVYAKREAGERHS